jgi:hypothetical protein
LDQTASVAQLAEQLICNQQVAGSTPAASSACPASRRRRPEFSTHQPFNTPHLPARGHVQPTNTASGQPPRAHNTGTQPKHPSLPLPIRARARGEFPERSKGSDCKSDGFFLRRFESCTPHCPMCLMKSWPGVLTSCPGLKILLRPTSARYGCSSMRV